MPYSVSSAQLQTNAARLVHFRAVVRDEAQLLAIRFPDFPKAVTKMSADAEAFSRRAFSDFEQADREYRTLMREFYRTFDLLLLRRRTREWE